MGGEGTLRTEGQFVGASTMMGARLGLAMWAILLASALPAAAQEMKPPQAPPPSARSGQDEDPRAKAVREAYEEQLRRERLEVTIKVRSATVDQIVEEFRRQTGWNIVLDRKNIPDDYRIDEFIVEKEPARRAFEAFATKAELFRAVMERTQGGRASASATARRPRTPPGAASRE